MHNTQPLASLVLLAELLREPEVATIFQSLTSLEWFCRCHRAELVSAGALLKVRNRWLADSARFPAAVRAIGERTAREAISAVGGDA